MRGIKVFQMLMIVFITNSFVFKQLFLEFLFCLGPFAFSFVVLLTRVSEPLICCGIKDTAESEPAVEDL